MIDTHETPAPVPRWVRAADALAALLAGIALWIAASGGSRHIILGVVVSFRTPLLFVYAAASVLAVRHLLAPRPNTWQRLRAGMDALNARPGLGPALRAFLATRLGVFAAAYLAVITFGFTPNPGFVLSPEPLANLPARFDAGWYAEIALDGYGWDYQLQKQRNIAFFPALPMLMRPVGAVFGMYQHTASRDKRLLRALWAGVLVSLAAFLWALWYLARIGEELLGAERGANAVLLLAAYPFSCFYGAPYTESVFLLGAVGAWYHYRRGAWVAASAFGLLAGFSRPNGCFVSIPLGILALQYAWRYSSDVRGATVRLATAAMPGMAMLIFTAYLYTLSRVWFAWARIQVAWGREVQGMDSLVSAFTSGNPYNLLNALGLVFGLALVVPVFRRLGPAWGLFVLANIALPFLSGGVLSMGRLTSALFPLFLALAALVPVRSGPAWAVAFGVMQGLCAALFYTWRELF